MKIIPLNHGQSAIVDDADYERMLSYKWRADWNDHSHAWYACTDIKGKKRYMHRLILEAKPGEIVDHIYHQTLDNRRSELRLCTNAQNLWNLRVPRPNKWGIPGVKYHKKNGKFTSLIRENGKRRFLGYFDTPEEAGAAYREACEARE